MITIKQAPALNSVLLDSNNTVISITSTNGNDHFFRAKIYVNDSLFDEQGWSKKDSHTAEKNLKSFYKAYFEKQFSSTFTNGLNEVVDAKVKIGITIEEYNINSGNLVDSLELPVYYIVHNINPVVFNDAKKIIILGIDAEVMLIPNFGKIKIPFYANTTNEVVTVTLKKDTNGIIDTATIAASTEKKIYEYQFDLSTANIANSDLYLQLEITVGDTTVTKYFKLYRYTHFNFPIKEIVYKNNFGFFIYAYLDGQLTIEDNLDIKSYEQYNYTDKVYEISEEETYNINSGSLVENEKAILRQIAISLDTKINWKGEWLNLVPNLKKLSIYKERNHNYSESFSFKVLKNKEADNVLIPQISGFIIYAVTDISFENMKLHYSSDTPLTNLIAEFSNDGVTWENPYPISGITSNQDVKNIITINPLFQYPKYTTTYVRLVNNNLGTITYSNIFTKNVIARISNNMQNPSVSEIIKVLSPKKLKITVTAGAQLFKVYFYLNDNISSQEIKEFTNNAEEFTFYQIIYPGVKCSISSNSITQNFSATFELIDP